MTRFRSTLAVIVAAGAVALLAPTAQAGKFYKWVDEKGATHYSEKAPAGTKSTTVKVGDTTSSDAEDEITALNKRRNAANAEKQKAADDAKDAASGQDENEQNKKLCDQHRKNLATLKSGTRILTKDAQGNQKYLSPEEVAAQLKISETEVQRCDEHKIPAGPGAAPSASKNGP